MFPHGRIANIHYLEEEHKILLDDKETGEIWDKGSQFPIQIKGLRYRSKGRIAICFS